MHPFIKRFFLAALMTLPAACAHYPRQYYDSGSGYYPNQYNANSGYRVVERNYYNTYTYPQPTKVYRAPPRDYSRSYPNKRDLDRRQPNLPAAAYRNDNRPKPNLTPAYNWNNQKATPNRRQTERDRRPLDSSQSAPGNRLQNWTRQEAKPQTPQFRAGTVNANRNASNANRQDQNTAQPQQNKRRGGHPGQAK